MSDIDQLAKAAYQGFSKYREQSAEKNPHVRIVPWEEVPQGVRTAWRCVAQSVAEAVPAKAQSIEQKLLSALLQPTIEMMLRSGIARMSCSKDKGFVLQMETGEVIEIEPRRLAPRNCSLLYDPRL